MAKNNNSLQSHRKSDKVKWILTLIAILALFALVIGMAVSLNKQITTVEIGGTAYRIGAIDDDTGKVFEDDSSICTKKAYTVDGLSCKPVKDAEIEYQLFFYNEDGEFVSATELLSVAFDGKIPETAVTFKVMIVPTSDEDGKVSLFEVLGYAKQLTVVVNR